MEAPEIIKIVRRRMEALNISSSITDTSEVTTTRADMTRLLADEYADLLKEIGDLKPPDWLIERRAQRRP